MKLFIGQGTINSIERIETLLNDERTALQLRQFELMETTEQGLRSVLERIIEMHVQVCGELEGYLRELRSLNEITLQINEMFL